MSWDLFKFVWPSSLVAALALLLAANLLGVSGGAVSWIAGDDSRDAVAPSSFVVGSSLAGAAFPSDFTLGGKSAGDRTVRRWIPLITADELEQEIERALEDRPDQIFIELRPLTNPPQAGRARLRINAFFASARHGLLSIFTGLPVADPTERDGIWLDGDYSQDKGRSDTEYGNKLISAETEDIATILDRARALDVEIIFLSFPRSASSLGKGAGASHHDVRQEIERTAARLESPLFVTNVVWPDEYFSDRIHLNARGQARYLAELRAWLANR